MKSDRTPPTGDVEAVRKTGSRREFFRQSLGAAVLVGASAVGVGSLGLVGCSEQSAPGDDGSLPDGPTPGPDRGLDGGSDGGPDAAPRDQEVDAPPKPRPVTTASVVIAPLLALKKQPDKTRAQWGLSKPGPGEKHARRDEFGVDALRPGGGAPSSLAFTVHATDLHVVDEESPARTIELDGFAGKVAGGWRYQDAYTTHALDAMVRKIRQLDAFRPVDFVLFSGDVTDNNQYNELMWFHSVVNGGMVDPNSGAAEDPLPGKENDPHDAFVALGLGTIPWYVLYGNHDGLVQGNLPLDNQGHSSVTGSPTRDEVTLIQLTKTNPPVCKAIDVKESPTPARCVPAWRKDLKTGKLVADPNRRHLTRGQWFDLHLKAAGKPSGHGFSAMNTLAKRGDYVVDPMPGVPLRLIGLDTCAGAGAAGFYDKNLVDDFLKPALAQAEQDQVLVIVASHHPTSGILGGGALLRAALNASSNVALHLVGHGHKNAVVARKGATVGQGYWEVQTCSLVDWPQQARVVELVDNRDGSGELWLTMIDYDTAHGALGKLAEASRFFSIYELQTGETGRPGGEQKDRNVVLPVLFPSAVAARLAALPEQPIASKLFA